MKLENFDRLYGGIVSMGVIVAIFGTIVLHAHSANRHNKELMYYNEKFVIVKAESSGAITKDKFHTPVFVKVWLIQRVADTTQFAELTGYNDNTHDFTITNKLWYNKCIGDTLFFKNIRKDRFFKINACKR